MGKGKGESKGIGKGEGEVKDEGEVKGEGVSEGEGVGVGMGDAEGMGKGDGVGEGEGEQHMCEGDSLCYDDNYVVVVTTQTISQKPSLPSPAKMARVRVTVCVMLTTTCCHHNTNLRPVKNGFSNLTKVQEGRDWPRKDVVNRRQKKALREGCRERKEARVVVSSREKMNNK